MSWPVALTTLLFVMAVELPDKTLVATVVLTTRYPALPVLAGVCAAFFLQCLIAVTAGGVLTLLPRRLVAAVVAVLFALGGLLLLHGSREAAEVADRPGRSGWSAAVTAFGVLFAAEWGDASQLATAALTARYRDPVAVFVGAFVALVTIAALAAGLGQWITRRVPLRLVQRIAGIAFLVFAGIAAAEAIRG